MESLTCITSSCGRCTPVYVAVSAVVITAVVIGVLAMMEMGPFAAFAYSEYVAGCALGFAAVLIVSVVNYKCCMEKGLFYAYCATTPEEIRQDAEGDIAAITAFLKLDIMPPITYSNKFEDRRYLADDPRMRNVFFELKYHQITYFKFKDASVLVVPHFDTYTQPIVIVRNNDAEITITKFDACDSKNDKAPNNASVREIIKEITAQYYQKDLRFINDKLNIDEKVSLTFSYKTGEYDPDHHEEFQENLTNLKRITLFCQNGKAMLAIPFTNPENYVRYLLLFKQDNDLVLQMRNDFDLLHDGKVCSNGEKNQTFLIELAKALLLHGEHEGNKVLSFAAHE